MLEEFAARLAQAVRATDSVTRLAGDEFVIGLRGVGTLRDGGMVAEKILQPVGTLWQFDGKRQEMTTSVGLAIVKSRAHSRNTLINFADEMLYAAKAAKCNTYRARMF